MLATSKPASAVTLHGGTAAQLSALALLWDLESRGFEIGRAGDKLRVRPVERLTANETAGIREYRDQLLALIDYCEAK